MVKEKARPGETLIVRNKRASFDYDLGDRFEAVELDPKDAMPGVPMAPHSVLTIHLNENDPDGPLTDSAKTRPSPPDEVSVVNETRKRLSLELSPS